MLAGRQGDTSRADLVAGFDVSAHVLDVSTRHQRDASTLASTCAYLWNSTVDTRAFVCGSLSAYPSMNGVLHHV